MCKLPRTPEQKAAERRFARARRTATIAAFQASTAAYLATVSVDEAPAPDPVRVYDDEKRMIARECGMEYRPEGRGNWAYHYRDAANGKGGNDPVFGPFPLQVRRDPDTRLYDIV